jgi:endoglucanase
MKRYIAVATIVAATGALALLESAGAEAARAAGPGPAARPAVAVCPSGLSASRDPANPLALPSPPGSNPLNGAQPLFFIQTPKRSPSGQAIAALLGLAPPDTESWAQFTTSLQSAPLAQALASNSELANQVSLLSLIADQPAASRTSSYTAGGAPQAIYGQLSGFLCRVHAVAPNGIPLLSTYFLLHTGHCSTETPSDQARFKRRVHAFAAAVADYPTVIFAEEDAVDTSGCMTRKGLAIRKKLLAYEVNVLAKIPHAVVYLDGGTQDANSPRFAARILNAAGIGKIRGFFLNATHRNWTSEEVAFGDRISKLTHGAHFIVNTADNGRGPTLNPHPSTQGVEDLCNPPGSGLGPQPTTVTGFPLVDAFEWTAEPGNSSGHCHPGDPDSGTFGVNLALGLAANANGQLGPGYPSRPY